MTRPGRPARQAPAAVARRRDRGIRAIGRPVAVTPTPRQPGPKPPRKPKDDIEALLEAASGNRRGGGGRPRRPRVAKRSRRPGLARGCRRCEREEMVKGMNAVMPKARECYSQFKVPGVATVKMTVSPAGRVSDAMVTRQVRRHALGQLRGNRAQDGPFRALGRPDLRLLVPLR